MKRILALCLLALFLLPVFALAASETKHAYSDPLEPVPAYPKQRITLRSGPGTHYTELGTYNEDTDAVFYEQETDGSSTWGLIEFHIRGKGFIRAYTNMYRIDPETEDIPWGNTITYCATLTSDTVPCRGPGEKYVSCNQTLPAGTELVLYHEELGYVMADFYFPDEDLLTRAWIPATNVNYQ